MVDIKWVDEKARVVWRLCDTVDKLEIENEGIAMDMEFRTSSSRRSVGRGGKTLPDDRVSAGIF